MAGVFGDGHVWEQPIGRPENGKIIILGDQAINRNGTVEFYAMSWNACKIMVSTSSDFSGASWVDLPKSTDSWKETLDISGESAGNVTIYYKFQNPGEEETEDADIGQETLLYDPTNATTWDQIMRTALTAVQRDYTTYKLEGALPNIQQTFLGDPGDIHQPFPCLGIEWDSGSFEFTDGIQITGSFQTLEWVFHVLTVDDVNVQDAYWKHSQLVKTLQGVCQVLIHNTTLDGLVSRVTPMRVDRVPYGDGRQVLGGEIHTEVLFNSDSI